LDPEKAHLHATRLQIKAQPALFSKSDWRFCRCRTMATVGGSSGSGQ
jgi:hypothetical protein